MTPLPGTTHPASHSSAPGKKRLLFVWIVRSCLVLLLWPQLMVFPFGTDASLDGSWPEVLLQAHLKGWQFGHDIIFTWGPWGFLNNQFHLGASGAGIKILWETLGKLGISIALVALTRRLPLAWQVVFIVTTGYFNGLFLDTLFLMLITLMVIGGLMDDKTPRWERLLWIASLAFLAQIKFTYTVFAAGGVASAVLLYALRRNYMIALKGGGSFLLSFILFWVAAGQNPLNIPSFLRLSLEISSGYSWAMGLDEKRSVFLSCAGLALACMIFIWRFWRSHADRPYAWATSLYLGASWFIVWKHGMVRADGHELGFIVYTLLLAVPLPLLCSPGRKWHWFSLAAILALVALEISRPGQVAMCRYDVKYRFVGNYGLLPHLTKLPARWQEQFTELARQVDLPEIRQIIGARSVDVFNFDQGVALVNGFNYTPRPIFQSYSAYTPRLMARNLEFFRSQNAPDFLLWNHSSIDQRYPTIDDALLINELPRAYGIVAEEGSHILLARRSPLLPEQMERKELLSRALRFSEVLVLPPAPRRAVWFQARLPLSLLGKLRALLYKPPLINLVVTDERGTETTWRLLPQLAQEGFLLSPLLETQADFASYLRGRGNKWIRTLRFETPKKQKKFWARAAGSFQVRLSLVSEISLETGRNFQEYVDTRVTDLAPDGVQSSVPLEPFPVGSARAFLFHPPASLTFQVPTTRRHFSGIFGIRDGAYQGEARTDGVEFIIEKIGNDGSRSVVWRRHLDPRQVPADRGPQSFSVSLPAEGGMQIALRTLAGPHNNARWDWSYVGGLSFTPTSGN